MLQSKATVCYDKIAHVSASSKWLKVDHHFITNSELTPKKFLHRMSRLGKTPK